MVNPPCAILTSRASRKCSTRGREEDPRSRRSTQRRPAYDIYRIVIRPRTFSIAGRFPGALDAQAELARWLPSAGGNVERESEAR